MANYYISTTGSDSTGDGSALNPWATFDKALGSGKAAGATLAVPTDLIVEPGVYRGGFDIQVTPSAAAPLRIIGDYDGALFGAAGKANPKTGLADIRLWSDDETTMSGVGIGIYSRTHVTLQRIRVLSGNMAWTYAALVRDSTNIIIRDCVFVGGISTTANCGCLRIEATTVTAMTVSVERCVMVGGPHAEATPLIIAGYGRTPAITMDISVSACLIIGDRGGVLYGPWSGGGLPPTGLKIQNCTILPGSGPGVQTAGSLVGPMAVVRDTLIHSTQGQGFYAGSTSHIDEDYNLINAASPRINTTAGSHSKTNAALAVNWLNAVADGGPFRPFLEPDATSLALGWGSHGPTPTLDLLGRPYADPPACGALERVDPVEPNPEPGGNTYIFHIEG